MKKTIKTKSTKNAIILTIPNENVREIKNILTMNPIFFYSANIQELIKELEKEIKNKNLSTNP